LPILVVADSEPMRRLYTNVLMDEGIDIVTASSKEEALSLLGPGVSLVITDLEMNGGAGLELVKLVRSGHPELPIICMGADPHLLSQASVAGADAFLTKPLAADDVRIVVRLLTI
jgi:DNA-binding NtrC family response regulator